MMLHSQTATAVLLRHWLLYLVAYLAQQAYPQVTQLRQAAPHPKMAQQWRNSTTSKNFLLRQICQIHTDRRRNSHPVG